jgi:quercetin dioxygenase-like cupin family protein
MSTRSINLQETFEAQFTGRGYGDPVPVFSANECEGIARKLEEENAPAEWLKGHAAVSRVYYDVVTDYRVTSLVSAVLGENVLLWGVSLVHRDPGQAHVWHSDIESSLPGGKFASVWIGLRNTLPETSLRLQPASQHLGVTVQECASKHGKKRAEIQEADIIAWSRELGAQETPETVPMRDGEALVFDGHVWHSSLNTSDVRRTALLLQYATTDTPVRMVDFRKLEWPFVFMESPWPPCVIIKGSRCDAVNRIVSPPTAWDVRHGQRLRSVVKSMQLPLEGDADTGFKPYPAFRGYTPALEELSCHVSVLGQDKCPHPPHQHPEDEILLVLSGEVKLNFPDLGGSNTSSSPCLRAGQLAWYPAGFHHTLRSLSVEPSQYLMIKWRGAPVQEHPPLAHRIFDLHDAKQGETDAINGFSPRLLFEGPTSNLRKLHCHLSTLAPGGGYAPHVDEYDVVLLLLEGEVETLGQLVKPLGVVLYAAGEPHGIHNPGTETAVYLVFELHGSVAAAVQALDASRHELHCAQEPASAPPVSHGEIKWQIRMERKQQQVIKKMARLEKLLTRMTRRRVTWYEKLTSAERWRRRWKRWLGRS